MAGSRKSKKGTLPVRIKKLFNFFFQNRSSPFLREINFRLSDQSEFRYRSEIPKAESQKILQLFFQNKFSPCFRTLRLF